MERRGVQAFEEEEGRSPGRGEAPEEAATGEAGRTASNLRGREGGAAGSPGPVARGSAEPAIVHIAPSPTRRSD